MHKQGAASLFAEGSGLFAGSGGDRGGPRPGSWVPPLPGEDGTHALLFTEHWRLGPRPMLLPGAPEQDGTEAGSGRALDGAAHVSSRLRPLPPAPVFAGELLPGAVLGHRPYRPLPAFLREAPASDSYLKQLLPRSAGLSSERGSSWARCAGTSGARVGLRGRAPHAEAPRRRDTAPGNSS